MKKHYKFIVIITLILLITGGGFYWFEYRPNLIRKQCNIVSNNSYVGLLKSNGYYKNESGQYVKDVKVLSLVKDKTDTTRQDELTIAVSRSFHEEADADYSRCLREKGL